jgi:hypothetical protein
VEYFLGSIVTFLLIIVATRLLRVERESFVNPIFLKYSQSYAHDLMVPYLPTNQELRLLQSRPTQSKKHDKGSHVRVLISQDKAYWIKNNAFYTAEVEHGEVIKETTRQVDTMGMDSVQLKEMVFIVEQLTRGIENDSSNTGQ